MNPDGPSPSSNRVSKRLLVFGIACMGLLLVITLTTMVPNLADVYATLPGHIVYGSHTNLADLEPSSTLPPRNRTFSGIDNTTNPLNAITIDYADILRQRVTAPPACPNSNHSLFNSSPLSHNWAPFYLRCEYHTTKTKEVWELEAFASKELFYAHVYKAAGTFIIQGLKFLVAQGKMRNFTRLLKPGVKPGKTWDPDFVMSPRDAPRNPQRAVLDSLLAADALIFSFVRDPVERFLSAFYEAHVRVERTHKNPARFFHPPLSYGGMSGIEIMRAWIREILRRTGHGAEQAKGGNRLIPTSRRRLFDKTFEFADSHLPPNIHFLFGERMTAELPFSFIGDVAQLAHDLPQLLEPFLLDEELARNHSRLLESLALSNLTRSRRADNWNRRLAKFSIDRAELSASDVRDICEIYFADYLCFPFDVPHECNVERMIDAHYGAHKEVVYRQCY